MVKARKTSAGHNESYVWVYKMGHCGIFVWCIVGFVRIMYLFIIPVLEELIPIADSPASYKIIKKHIGLGVCPIELEKWVEYCIGPICTSKLSNGVKMYMNLSLHCSDVITSAMASQTTYVSIVYSTVFSGVDQRKPQSSESHSPKTGEFPAQWASNAKKAFIWWRNHV